MNADKNNVAVFIGRFQPFHAQHEATIRAALCEYDNVIVLVGSAGAARSAKNPFTFEERKDMILSAINDPESDVEENIIVLPLVDFVNNDDKWFDEVNFQINFVANTLDPDNTITLIGHKKDESSYYLEMFNIPGMSYRSTEDLLGKITPLNSTDIRNRLFELDLYCSTTSLFVEKMISSEVTYWLRNWIDNNPEIYDNLREEHQYIKNYRDQFVNLPYPPTFVTADVVALYREEKTDSVSVMMIRRKGHPGKGLLAVPGGFMDANRDLDIQSTAQRELLEETGVKLDVTDTFSVGVFSKNGRDQRGRIVTFIFAVWLTDKELSQIKAADDAESIEWITLDDMPPSTEFFADHNEIVNYATEVLVRW
jgi:bifunctional NMN adenylyltransferase/nudix hydrolase